MLGIYPENDPEVVHNFAKSQGWDLSQVGAKWPEPVTIKDALTKFCDLSGLLKKSQLRKLSNFAKIPEKTEYYIKHYSEFKESYKSIIDVIHENEIQLEFEDFWPISGKITVFFSFRIHKN